jgi:hypothetical protein
MNWSMVYCRGARLACGAAEAAEALSFITPNPA